MAAIGYIADEREMIISTRKRSPMRNRSHNQSSCRGDRSWPPSLPLRPSNNSGPVLKAIGDDLARIVTLFARWIYEDRVQHRNRRV